MICQSTRVSAPLRTKSATSSVAMPSAFSSSSFRSRGRTAQRGGSLPAPGPFFTPCRSTEATPLKPRTVVQAAEEAGSIVLGGEDEENTLTDAASRECAIAIAGALAETKCMDISVLHVAPLVTWTSYMVFASVFSKPQLLAALDRVEKAAVELHEREQQNQPGSSPWECLDFGDVVVHIMTNEQREYYDIESFYATAAEVDLPFPTNPKEAEAKAPTWTTSAGTP